jgi:hypothetical protein
MPTKTKVTETRRANKRAKLLAKRHKKNRAKAKKSQ